MAVPVPGVLNTMNGLFKEIYASDLQDLIPDGVKLLQKIPFSKKDKMLGNFYHFPVILGQEHGVTFSGSGDEAFDLLAPIAGQIKDATVQGSQLVMRSAMSYAQAARSAEGGAKAFKQATKYLVGNMLRSVTKKLEIEMLYGQIGYATLAVMGAPSATLPIPAAQWAPGIWAGAEKMPIEIRDSAGANPVSRTVVSVDFAARTVTVNSPYQAAAGDVIWHQGAYGNEFAGLHKIITATTPLFGVDPTAYSLFKGNEYDASASALSFAKVQEAIAKAVEKGLDSDVMVLVNPEVWSDLLTDQAALRMYDSSYGPAKMENGAKELKFHGQNGAIEIVPSIYCKRGFAYGISLDEMVRVGSTDVTFRRPIQGDEFFRDLESNAGYELRCYTDQALACSAPGRNVLIYNIA
jgi:hypothetical protein